MFPPIKHPEGHMRLTVRYLIAPRFRLLHLESVLSEQFGWSLDDQDYPRSQPVDVPVMPTMFPADNGTRSFQMGNPYQWGNEISKPDNRHFDVPGSKRIEVPRAATNHYDPLTSVLISWMEREDGDQGRSKQIMNSAGEHRKIFRLVSRVEVSFQP